MSEFRDKICRVSMELRQKLEAGDLRPADLQRWRDPIGNLVVTALWDEGHPLSRMLASLRTLIDEHREPPVELTTPKPLLLTSRHLFQPMPNVGSLTLRSLWPLQLLLLTTLMSPHAGILAAQLGLATDVAQRLAAEAMDVSVKYWSVFQHGQYLWKALQCLDYPNPPLPLRLEGNLVHLAGGEPKSLSEQEAIMLRMLIDHVNQPVTHGQFKHAGINYPAKVKERLTHKLKGTGIARLLTSSPHAYTLHEDAP